MTEQAQDFQIHVRYNGTSYEFTASQIDVGNLSTDVQVKAAVAGELNVAHDTLDGYDITRHENGNITLHPQATFGEADVLAKMRTLASEEGYMTKGMSKATLQEFLLIAHGRGDPNIEVQVEQDRPSTLAIVHVNPPLITERVKALGFTKVSRPDKWDAEYGVTLAIEKALAKIAKRLGV